VVDFFGFFCYTESMIEHTDAELISAHLAGDTAAFDVLVMRYLKLVYSVTFHYIKNTQDAEDLAQDVFIKTLRNLKKFDLEKPFKPWILRIARNHALDWIKRKKPLLLSDFEAEDGENLLQNIPDTTPLPDVQARQNEALAELQNALKKLSPNDRLILQLRYLNELSFKEISQQLGEAIDTIKSRSRRALQKARKLFETGKNLA